MTRPNSLVSVIVPAFNAAKTAGEAIDSVLGQTAADVEVLAVDDGSTDATLEVLEEIRERERDRVRVLTHPDRENRGVAASRNLALDHATGEFIAFLDADDAWLPNKLEVQLASLQSAPEHIGLVFADAWLCRNPDTHQPMADQALERDPRYTGIAERFQGDHLSSFHHLFFEPATHLHNCIPSPTPLVRRSFFEAGLRFIGPPRLNTQFEDYLMWLMLSLECEFLAIDSPLAIYRAHDAQFVTRFLRDKTRVDFLLHYEELVDVLFEEYGQRLDDCRLRTRCERRFNELICRSIRHVRFGKSERTERIPLAQLPGLLALARRHGILNRTCAALSCRGRQVLRFRLANLGRRFVRLLRKRQPRVSD